MNYLSVCSGIEAATVAWHPLGWKPTAFSEIEKFPSAVLAHHYPDVPNLGDMTKFHEWPDSKINLLVGGTPCQAFSVAGLRQGLSDPRGNLTLTFLGVADRYRPEWLVWENVPGVLSDRTNAFGQFLAGLGELGYGFAYRVLDAQYFGVPQRRKRVFVVGCLGGWERSASVLFERESLLGNPPPGREAGKGVAPCLAARTKGGGGLGTDFDCDGGLHVIKGAAIGREPQNGPQYGEVLSDGSVYTLNCTEVHGVAHSLRAEGFDASEDGTGRGTPLVPAKWPAEISSTLNASFGEKQGLEDQHALGGGSLFVPGVKPSLIAFNHNAQTDQMNFDPHTTPSPTCSQGPAIGFQDDTTPKAAIERIGAIRADAGGEGACVKTGMSVRRLTPTECERLQGFPDGYTNIPWRLHKEAQKKGVSYESLLLSKGIKLREPAGEECPDGPRYKALGNSMAVPCMAWIGRRIQAVSRPTYDFE